MWNMIQNKEILRIVQRITPYKLRRLAKRFIRTYLSNSHPDWDRILKPDWIQWQDAVAAAKDGPRCLIATSTGGLSLATHIESMLAVALTLRGINVHFLLCDEVLPACSESMIQLIPDDVFSQYGPKKDFCKQCHYPAGKMYRSLGLRVHDYSEYITEKEFQVAEELSSTIPFAEIANYVEDGLSVGEHALSGALRFYGNGSLENEPLGEPCLRRYFNASLLTVYAVRRLLNNYDFKYSCFHHGIYVPQGLVGEVLRKKNIPLVNWCVAYRQRCFIFSHHDTYHHTLLTEQSTNWENMEWNDNLESEIMTYLKSRWQGTHDWIRFNENPQEELSVISKELGVDFSRPCVGMLTNVMWDAQLHYRANAFANMLEWVLFTIRYFASRPDLQLIIRVHPAEIKGTIPSRQPIIHEIKKKFPELPSNIIIIPPESPISTYVVMMQCNAVLIYGTKAGVELSSMSLPIIVGGEAWIRNKGITMDASSPEEYLHLLNQLPLNGKINEVITQRARKYAYHFFFRRMIPLSCVEPVPGWPPYKLSLSSIKELMPGMDTGLDVICDGILNGREFIYPAEIISQPMEHSETLNAIKHLAC
jgi:hypothetical protein